MLFGLVVALMLLLGSMGPGVAAQGDPVSDGDCQPGSRFDAAQKACVEDAMLVAADDAGDDACPDNAAGKVADTACINDTVLDTAPDESEPTVTPTSPGDSESGQVGTVQVVSHLCPAEASDIPAACTEDGPDLSLVLTTVTGEQQRARTDGGSPPTAVFEPVPAGAVILAADDAAGYMQLGGSCDGGVVSPQVQIDLSPGQVVQCDWFVTPAGASTGDGQAEPDATATETNAAALKPAQNINDNDGGNIPPPVTGSVSITVYQCLAPSYDLDDLEVATDGGGGSSQPAGEFAGCTPDLTGVKFTSAPVQNQTLQKFAWSAGSPAQVSFTSVPLGQNYLIEFIPYNYTTTPVVICRSDAASEQRFEAANGIVIWDFQPDEVVTCDWYTYQAGAPGSITIKMMQCESEPVAADNLSALRAGCTRPLRGYPFTVSLPAASFTTTQNTDNTGVTTFDEILPGNYQITQYDEGSFRFPAVFCRQTIPFEPTVPFRLFSQTVNPDQISINWNLAGNASLYCEWFVNKQGFLRILPGNAIFSVNAHICPDGIDPSNSDIYSLAATCHEPALPVKVTLTQSYGGGSSTQTTPATDYNVVSWLGIAAYPVTIEMEYLSQYDGIIPWCDPQLDGIPGNGPTEPQDVYGTYSTKFDATIGSDDAHAFCDVYYYRWIPKTPVAGLTDGGQIPAQPSSGLSGQQEGAGSLVINLHGCPAGFSVKDADLASFGTQCVDVLTGVVVTLTSEGAKPVTATTSGDFASIAAFEDVPAGPVQVEVALPEGYTGSQVYCGTSSSTVSRRGTAGTQLEMTGNRAMQATLPAGGTVLCDWYAIPG